MIKVIDLIAITKPYLTRTLISNESLSSIENLCTGLPPVFHAIYFEIRANNETRVDFTTMASTWNFSNYLKEGTIEEKNQPAIIEKWLKNGRIPMISYEFDFIDYHVQNSFILWTIHRGYIEKVNPNTDPSTTLATIKDCLNYEGFFITEDLTTEINKCLYKLPQSAHVLHILNMRARGVEGVRLIISIPVNFCISFLESINWKGNNIILQKVIQLVRKFNFGISLQLSFPKEIRSSLGIEVYPINPNNIDLNQNELTEFFKLLKEQKLIDSNKLDDVIAWIGISKVDKSLIDWKMDIIREVMVKFILNEQDTPEIKIYLGANAIYKLF